MQKYKHRILAIKEIAEYENISEDILKKEFANELQKKLSEIHNSSSKYAKNYL